MRIFINIVLISILGFTSLIAQQDFRQKENRKLIQQFEKERFNNQLQLLTKSPTQNQEDFDIHFYTLNLGLWPATELLKGAVVIEGESLINGLDHIEIDLLSNMVIDSIKQDVDLLSYTHTNDLINIDLVSMINQGDLFSVEVFYSGNPQSGGLGTWGWDYHLGEPIIWTLSQPFGSPAWWPCKDDPKDKADSVFLNITVPEDLVVASNGLLVDTSSVSGSRITYSWETHYPISTYLVSLAISNYEQFSDWYVYSPTDSMELVYYVYPEDLAAAQEDFNVTDDMMEVFASIFGEYPFLDEKYGMSEFPWGGAMEHQTNTSYGEPLIQGNHFYDYINAHEIAHQWFGDCITMRRWSHIWLNEGFASYSEALWEESIGGSTAYHEYMESQDPGSFQGSLFVVDSLNPNSLFSNTVYDKGSWTLHMLRGVLGDSLFFECVNSYATDPGFTYATAVTEDLRNLCESVTGQDLHWFFEEWVYRPGRPNYVFNWETVGTSPPYQTTLNLLQTNEEPYKMPVQIHLLGNGLDTLITVWDSLDVQQFQFTTDLEPIDLQVDPDNWILKNLIEGDIYTVAGQVIDISDSSGVADAEVYWAGPFDPFTGSALDFGIDTTDINGNFQFEMVTGDYGMQALKENYLQSPQYFHSVSSDTSGLILTLTQPQASYSIDTLNITLENNQPKDTLLVVSNTGTGDMYVQLVSENFSGSLFKPGKGYLLYDQFPIKDLLKASPQTAKVFLDPIDSLWMQIHHDVQEDPSNEYDLADTYVQDNEGIGYLKLTTHLQPVSFNDMRINIVMDTDNNSLTGDPSMGADYLVAVGDFGGGFYGYLLSWNASFQGWEFIDQVDYFSSSTIDKSIIVGVEMSTIGDPDLFRIIIEAFNSNNVVQSRDFVPSSYLGYLSVSTIGVSWLMGDPLYGNAAPGIDAEFVIIIDPSGLNPGYHTTGITIFSSHANEMERFYIPVNLDYTTTDIANEPELPDKFALHQNYPNPFNPSTTIKYDLKQETAVLLKIFNILGQEVRILINKDQKAGRYDVVWDGNNNFGKRVSSGVYLYRISAGDFVMTKKLILQK